MKNIVTIGGGTGQYTILRGLKNYDIGLTALVSIADDGGSTGRLRVEFGVLAPGDLRNCLLALSNESELEEMIRFFNHRFPDSGGDLGRHNLGNLIIAAAQQIYGNIEGIKKVAKMLEVKGKVLPISPDAMNLFASTFKGTHLNGQHEVSYPKRDERIKEIWLDPPAFVYGEAASTLRQADTIVICPGEFYGSILPNFLVQGVADAIKASKAKIIYVCNLVTKQGALEFKASDFRREIEKYCGKNIDYVICNSRKPSQTVVDKYRAEDSYFVKPDLRGANVVKEDLLIESKSGGKVIARHDLEKTARLIMSLA